MTKDYIISDDHDFTWFERHQDNGTHYLTDEFWADADKFIYVMSYPGNREICQEVAVHPDGNVTLIDNEGHAFLGKVDDLSKVLLPIAETKQ